MTDIEEIGISLANKFKVAKFDDEVNEYEFELKKVLSKKEAVDFLFGVSYELREKHGIIPVAYPRGDHDGNIIELKYHEPFFSLTLFARTNNRIHPT